MACDRQSEWCTRTHHTCHLTVPLPALSHIPSPLLHTSASHRDCSTVVRLLLANICCNCTKFLSRMHFLCLKALAPSMNNTLATNSYSRKQVTDPLTEDPLSASFSSSPASCSSDPVISASSLSISCSTSPSYAHREQNLLSLILHTHGRAFVAHAAPRKRYKYNGLYRLPLGKFSHFAP